MARCVAAFLFLLAGLPAQVQVVLPGSHLLAEGTGSTGVPFGRSTPVRVQMVYDGALLPGACSVTAIAFRLDGGTSAAGKQVDCEIRMSTMPAPLVSMSAVFAQNRGLDETAVLPRQMQALAGQAAGATPNAFLPALQLPVPFAYDPAAGPLVVEVVVHGQPPGAYSLDTTWICTTSGQPSGPLPCPGSVLPLRVESATGQVMWGRQWTLRVLDALPHALCALALGFPGAATWQGQLLPVDLGPLGAPGCFVSIDPLFSVLLTALGDGSAAWTTAIPNVPALLGVRVVFQAGALDAQANQLGIVTSQARTIEVCGWERVGRVWATDLAAAVGQWEIGVAPVAELTIQ